MKKVALLIPCYNEESGLQEVLGTIPYKILKRMGYELNVIVIDNNSTDRTAEVARSFNVELLSEKRKGKGYALKTGMQSLAMDTDYVLVIDGDNTYRPEEMPRLLELLRSDFCDVVVGSRLGGKINQSSLTFVHRAGNWLFTFMVRQFYKTNVTDVLSGYIAMRREVVDVLRPHLKSTGFAIEMEMITKLARCGFETYSVPITYDERHGESKLEALGDGVLIFAMLIKNMFWKPRGLLASSIRFERQFRPVT